MDRLSDYDYELPEELIAQAPLAERSASRLLHLDPTTGAIHHRQFAQCVDLLEEGDVLVLNDTRVSARRLQGHKSTGGAVEALLLHETEPGVFRALLRPGKRLAAGSVVEFGQGLRAVVQEYDEDGVREVRFELFPDLHERLNSVGHIPLPPYIHETIADPERYQTVYGKASGSAAAPTAGLHFTPEILDSLRRKGVELATVTLHVSIDTFRPVQTENLGDHVMHGEICEISDESAKIVNSRRGRLIAVGTTSVRTLETFANENRQLEPGQRVSKLFIRPGYVWRITDGMFTNFHMPRTTMLAMISALAGADHVREAYRAAVAERYRFLSFGDSMLIL